MWVIKVVFQKEHHRLEKFCPASSGDGFFSGLYISGERGDKKQYTEVSLLDGTAFL